MIGSANKYRYRISSASRRPMIGFIDVRFICTGACTGFLFSRIVQDLPLGV